MASSNPKESEETVKATPKAPVPTKSSAASSPPPKSAAIGRARTEYPREPDMIYTAFEKPKDDVTPIGNKTMELSLKLEGKLGYFLPRTATHPIPTYVTLNDQEYRTVIYSTLQQVLHRLLRLKGNIEDADANTRVEDTALSLMKGICVLTYMKLRAVNSLATSQLNLFRRKPKAPIDLKVPVPYALAISQLGRVKVRSLEEEKTLSPTCSLEATKNFLIGPNFSWSSTEYAQAREYAESLGMQFASADLGVKLGSAWWLLRRTNDDGTYGLDCILPEDNYTEAAVVLNSLFYRAAHDGVPASFFTLDGIDNHSYGFMLRDPHDGINLSSYFAIEGRST
ncbi:hypothetical protein CFOL_v3_06864 [Cephalotus follicularis]|uniref:Uncharacterized protein n=1 Tax=Cephalotus follicularis TaxID=3775 RepID=A0A1Q3B5L2_CEPFO|nr:hypothetical protein CFOL_v3_06864 [Cephalotus follicularis]